MRFPIPAMIAIFLFLTSTMLVAQPRERQKGDVNGDGIVNIVDALEVANYILEIKLLIVPEIWRADCNSPLGRCEGDGVVNIQDIIKIVNLILEVDSCPVLDIDGNEYHTVRIGNQVWMVENLKVTHYRNGDVIPNVPDSSVWWILSTGAYCNYKNDEDYVATYGRLYNWYAADDTRNIAPVGWHVPTDEEWKELEMYLGMSQSQADLTGWRGTNEGSKLAGNARLWSSDDLKNNPEFGTSGFSALPAGFRDGYGSFGGLGYYTGFWSATEGSSYYLAWCRELLYIYSDVERLDVNMQLGFSVRCLRDD